MLQFSFQKLKRACEKVDDMPLMITKTSPSFPSPSYTMHSLKKYPTRSWINPLGRVVDQVI